MFSAVAGMASMFGLQRKEETQTAVLEDIYNDLEQVKTSFQITIVPESEEREKEFDKEKRHQELLAAFRRSGLALRRAASSKDGDKDKDKKGNWLSNLATAYFSYRVLKGFIKRFFKVMRLGRLWPLLRGAGLLLSRLFWPLAIATALIWAIPKIIDNWPAIVQTAKDTMNSIWDTIKGWLSFLGVDFDEDMDEDDRGQDDTLGEEDEIAPNYTPMWDATREVWIVNNIPLPWIPENRKDVARTVGQMMRAGATLPDIKEALGTQGLVVPQQTILGDDVSEISGFDNNFVSMVKEAEGFRGEAYQDEGGNWTVGYGHTGADVMQGTTMSESAATAQLGTDLSIAKKTAQMQVDRDFGSGTFGNLSQNKQNLLTDVAFNTGSVTSMPKLTSAVVTGDKATMTTEYKRFMTTSSGERKALTGRNQLVRDNLIAPILAAPSSSIGPGVTSTMITPISTTPIPTTLTPKITVIENDPVVVDNSVNTTSVKSSHVTNKDYGTTSPFMGMYE